MGNFRRLFRRKLEKDGRVKRTRPHNKNYQGHKSAGWKDLRKLNKRRGRPNGSKE